MFSPYFWKHPSLDHCQKPDGFLGWFSIRKRRNREISMIHSFTKWEPTNIHKLLLLKLFQDVSISSASFTPTIWNHLPFVPIMYGIFTYPYHKNQPNISKYISYSTWILRGTTGLPSLNLTYSLKNWPSQKERIVSQPSIFKWPFVSIRICLHGIFTSIWLIFMLN